MPSQNIIFAEFTPFISIFDLKRIAKSEGILSVQEFAAGLGFEVVSTFPHFGGIRHWFRCPICGRRAGIVYLRKEYACRRCSKVLYLSQYESARQKNMTKTFKLMLKLESLDNKKPKYKQNIKYYKTMLTTIAELAASFDIIDEC